MIESWLRKINSQQNKQINKHLLMIIFIKKKLILVIHFVSCIICDALGKELYELINRIFIKN